MSVCRVYLLPPCGLELSSEVRLVPFRAVLGGGPHLRSSLERHAGVGRGGFALPCRSGLHCVGPIRLPTLSRVPTPSLLRPASILGAFAQAAGAALSG